MHIIHATVKNATNTAKIKEIFFAPAAKNIARHTAPSNTAVPRSRSATTSRIIPKQTSAGTTHRLGARCANILGVDNTPARKSTTASLANSEGCI